jgi:hypothetical protein
MSVLCRKASSLCTIHGSEDGVKEVSTTCPRSRVFFSPIEVQVPWEDVGANRRKRTSLLKKSPVDEHIFQSCCHLRSNLCAKGKMIRLRRLFQQAENGFETSDRR